MAENIDSKLNKNTEQIINAANENEVKIINEANEQAAIIITNVWNSNSKEMEVFKAIAQHSKSVSKRRITEIDEAFRLKKKNHDICNSLLGVQLTMFSKNNGLK